MALKKLFEELFDISRAMYPFWYYTKNCLFSSFHFYYLEHQCIGPPFFALHLEHHTRHRNTLIIKKSWQFVQEYSWGERAAYGYFESHRECGSSQGYQAEARGKFFLLSIYQPIYGRLFFFFIYVFCSPTMDSGC